MAAYALADMLPDFGKRPPRLSGVAVPDDNTPARADAPEIDVEALLAEERARTEMAVSERLEAEHGAALLAERQNHANEILEIERRHGEEAGARIEAGLREIEARVAETVTGTVARILGPIVTGEVLKRSVEELAGAISEALEDVDAVTIRVSGPQSLFSALAAKMGEKAKHLRHRDEEGFDLTVDVNGSLMETRLVEWQAVVNEALG